jgi:hypothetical protein
MLSGNGWIRSARTRAVHGAAHVGGSGRAGPHAHAWRARTGSGDTGNPRRSHTRGTDARHAHARSGTQGDARTDDAPGGHTDVLAINDRLGRRGNREEGQTGSYNNKLHVKLRQRPGQAE